MSAPKRKAARGFSRLGTAVVVKPFMRLSDGLRGAAILRLYQGQPDVYIVQPRRRYLLGHVVPWRFEGGLP